MIMRAAVIAVIAIIMGCALAKPLPADDKIEKFRALLEAVRNDQSWMAAHGDNGGLEFAVPMEDDTAIVSISFMKPEVIDMSTVPQALMDPRVVEIPQPISPVPVVQDHGSTPSERSTEAEGSSTPEYSTTQHTNVVEQQPSHHISGYLVLGVPCLLLSPLLIILIVYRIFYKKTRKIGMHPEGNSGRWEPQTGEKSFQDIPTILSIEAVDPACFLSPQVSQEACRQQ